jgi:hypothetical protein
LSAFRLFLQIASRGGLQTGDTSGGDKLFDIGVGQLDPTLGFERAHQAAGEAGGRG